MNPAARCGDGRAFRRQIYGYAALPDPAAEKFPEFGTVKGQKLNLSLFDQTLFCMPIVKQTADFLAYPPVCRFEGRGRTVFKKTRHMCVETVPGHASETVFLFDQGRFQTESGRRNTGGQSGHAGTDNNRVIMRFVSHATLRF